MTRYLREFLKIEASGGIILVLAAVLAMVVANSPLDRYYDLFIDLPVEVRVGPLHLAKPLLLWINDGLMAIFFFLIGLELKREFLDGDLADPRTITLPALGAAGGMAVPALIYVAFNLGDPFALQGWAIPAATDIAFALGILTLLGERVPVSLKVFLVSLAIFDDVGAIIIIALFYSKGLSQPALYTALACLLVLLALNLGGVRRKAAYILVGLCLWVAVLKSGVHATLAGVLLALFIPMRDSRKPDRSPLRDLEEDLHGVVTYAILPLFAFANAGISLAGSGLDTLLHPVPLGIAAGLFVGKQVGVFLFCLAGMGLGLARLPEGASLRGLYGVALLCGVGFTMSLFIGSLAFDNTGLDLAQAEGAAMLFDERVGIVLGSLVSGLSGYLVLRKGAFRY